MARLNIGCGKDVREGWYNVDKYPYNTRVRRWDIESEGHGPWMDNSFDHMEMSHVIEHLERPLVAMENLWRIAEPGCTLQIIVPHGASDEAWEDQTHLRPYFPGSFNAFGQPYYWKADYLYYGDWKVTDIWLEVYERYAREDLNELFELVENRRNICRNLFVTLEAVKPARPQVQEEPKAQPIGIKYV